jgi:pimeloyl-ACP methyl ester carboxylesterase
MDSINNPVIDFGGSGLPLYFLHANGYPPACYEPLLKLLASQYHTVGMLMRPLWSGSDPAAIKDWKPLSKDFIDFLNGQNNFSSIAVGHSVGAIVALRAALKEPERFKAIVLLEPVLFPYYLMAEWVVMRALGLGYRLHPNIRGALQRRRNFDDLDQVYEGYRRRPIFRYITDENLRIFINGMTKAGPSIANKSKSTTGYQLVYSPEWEVQIYYTGLWNDWDIWKELPRLEIPTLILRGAETDTFWESAARKVKIKNPKIKVITLDGSTHLLPLEKPQEVFDAAQSFLKDVIK